MFRNWVLQNFPFIEDDFDALTDYQLFCKICGYVMKYSKDNEEMKKKIEEFQHYFDNLDVQEEINNKLDEMAESGELAEIINEEIFENLNQEVKDNKEYSLSDNVQGMLHSKLENLFTTGYSISSVIITSVNENSRGIAVANDWTEGGSGGTKFNIVTFNYDGETISNKVTRASLLDGHSNSMCEIGNNKVLICASGYYYIYDLLNNNYTTVSDVLPYFSAVANDSNGNVYGAQPYDPSNGTTINKLYKLSVDNVNDTISVTETITLDDYNEKIGGNSQGMVIYNGLIIFTSFAPAKLCIYDLNTLKYLKTQLFTSPYLTEFEDGFIYYNKLMLIDTLGNLIEPDIYDKDSIGTYYHNNVTKSLTDVLLYNEPVLLNFEEDNGIEFTKYMHFGANNVNTDIGTIGTFFESLTVYLGIAYINGTTIHQLKPFDILGFKSLSNAELKNNQDDDITGFSNKFNTDIIQRDSTNLVKYDVSGVIAYRGGDSIPRMDIFPYKEVVSENFTSGTTSIIDTTTSGNELSLYLLKVVGHRKVGDGY